MDQIDISLSLLLSKNSRMPLRSLAEQLSLSPSAVHKRMQDLIDIGIIQRFSTGLSFKALPGFIVTLNGRSQASSLQKNMQQIGKHPSVYKIVIAAGNYVYIHAVLKDISDLETFTNTIQEQTDLSNTEILLIPSPMPVKKTEDRSLSNLDYRLIHALSKNSRKLNTELAEELGISSKTVQRRLNYLETNELIGYGIHWVPTASTDIISFFHVMVNDIAKKDDIIRDLQSNYHPTILSISKSSSNPTLLILNVWTKTMKQIKTLHQDLENTNWFSQVYSNIFYDLMMFDTWRDDYIKDHIQL